MHRLPYVKDLGILYQCKCICGKEKTVTRSHLLRGLVQSCGCLFDEYISGTALDLTDQKFGRLSVLYLHHINRHKQKMYFCKCDCGETRIVNQNALQAGKSKSCGCLNREICKEMMTGQTYTTTHGESRKTGYSLLNSARSRAKAKGIPFNLTLNDIVIPVICPITNKEIKACKGKIGMSSPTLDKVIIEKGYVKGNVRVISNEGNILKGFNSLQTAQNIVKYMTEVIEAQDNDARSS